jgi:beta-N-acetylhexosaminidase
MGGGCDIVLHCNGLMDEMKAVVKEAVPLAGAALRRAEAVEAGFAPADAAHEETLRQEFQSLVAVS